MLLSWARTPAVTREFVVQRPNRSPRPEWNILRTAAGYWSSSRSSPNARNAPLSPSRNEPFSGWAKTLLWLCGAIAGRRTFAGQIIETGTTSCRLARHTAVLRTRHGQHTGSSVKCHRAGRVPEFAGHASSRRRRGKARPEHAPIPCSRLGASCASSAAARGGPVSWPRPSRSFKPARSQDEKAHRTVVAAHVPCPVHVASVPSGA
jgi:hypothetical protein